MTIISGIVESGRKLGRTLGFPTANVALDTQSKMEIGVYLSRISIEGGEWLNSVTNVGINPTIKGHTSLRSESYIFDFTGDLYGRNITVELLRCIRHEMRFNSIEELRQQIQQDVEQAKSEHKYRETAAPSQ